MLSDRNDIKSKSSQLVMIVAATNHDNILDVLQTLAMAIPFWIRKSSKRALIRSLSCSWDDKEDSCLLVFWVSHAQVLDPNGSSCFLLQSLRLRRSWQCEHWRRSFLRGSWWHPLILDGNLRGHLTCTNRRAQAAEQKIARNEVF